MPKLGRVKTSDGSPYGWTFHCPGCQEVHLIGVQWEFNGDLEKPTFSPSYLARRPGMVCHSFIRDGQMQFLGDCTHDLAGQTVDLPEWDGWGGY